jgi:hypothetical protein
LFVGAQEVEKSGWSTRNSHSPVITIEKIQQLVHHQTARQKEKRNPVIMEAGIDKRIITPSARLIYTMMMMGG